MSTVIQNAYQCGVKKSTLILGNSYTQTAIDPSVIDPKGNSFIFARGGTSSVEILLWLYKNGIFPKTVMLELNTRELTNQYFADFDIMKPDSEKIFDLFKNKVEMTLRFNIEKYLTFLSYHVSLKDCLRMLIATKSATRVFELAFYPDKKHPNYASFHSNGFIENNHTNPNCDQKIINTNNYYLDFKKRVYDSKPNIASTLLLWKFLLDEFEKNGSKIILFRLPKNKRFINCENKITPLYFSSLENMASQNNHLSYVDLSLNQYHLKFEKHWTDGAHWDSPGAKQISTLLKTKLLFINKQN